MAMIKRSLLGYHYQEKDTTHAHSKTSRTLVSERNVQILDLKVCRNNSSTYHTQSV